MESKSGNLKNPNIYHLSVGLFLYLLRVLSTILAIFLSGNKALKVFAVKLFPVFPPLLAEGTADMKERKLKV